ncbi:PROTEIN PHOSPHATASE 2C [Salix purpurea]|uniref:protein-serine/threonine phosphatase n=1 Tax=Salix purpurea TaxID=77065 RepID=A0A9Q0Z279_SALPP|nr:PROTEIN PHOSPHATASE 2C [Salix purpurea]
MMCNVIDAQYQLCLAKDQQNMTPSTPVFDSISTEISRFESVVSCTETLNETADESSAAKPFPCIRSGSYADIGTRPSMDDEHIRIDDLSAHLGSYFKCPSSFYAVFDGHGGPDAAAYVKRNAMRLFFEDRVEELGGYIEDDYVNGYLSVTRALGDWDFKLPLGSSSPLIAEPDVQQFMLTEDDEFMIICCDGIWDVMPSQYAVSLVRRGLRRHNDPELSARELVIEASHLHSADNLTAVVVCFSLPNPVESCPPQSEMLRCFCFSEEARNTLKSLFEGN